MPSGLAWFSVSYVPARPARADSITPASVQGRTGRTTNPRPLSNPQEFLLGGEGMFGAESIVNGGELIDICATSLGHQRRDCAQRFESEPPELMTSSQRGP